MLRRAGASPAKKKERGKICSALPGAAASVGWLTRSQLDRQDRGLRT